MDTVLIEKMEKVFDDLLGGKIALPFKRPNQSLDPSPEALAVARDKLDRNKFPLVCSLWEAELRRQYYPSSRMYYPRIVADSARLVDREVTNDSL